MVRMTIGDCGEVMRALNFRGFLEREKITRTYVSHNFLYFFVKIARKCFTNISKHMAVNDLSDRAISF